MSGKPVNRRVQFTKNALREAMIELITEKPLTSITVKDVCARADINRSTFYLHYKDVDSLLVEVEDYAIDYINLRFSSPEHAFDELAAFLNHLKATPRVYKLFFALGGERGDPRFNRRLQELTYKAFERGWNEHVPVANSDNEKTLVYAYILPGIVSVFYSWLTDKMPGMSAEQLVFLLQKLVFQGVTGLGDILLPFLYVNSPEAPAAK